MINLDVIELALTSPIEWGKFERLAVEILTQDDLPRLRKVGGVADAGIDAIEEVFYQNETQIDVVVQVTSQRAQKQKLRQTLDRLNEAGVECGRLVMVYRHPVSSQVRVTLQQEGFDQEVAIDVRDRSYLITRVAMSPHTLFARYFGDVRTQVDNLLAQDDPLRVTPDRERHGILASLGAYVVQPRAQLARKTLFEKTVLGVLFGARAPIELGELRTRVAALMPEERIELDRLRAAVDSLRKSDECDIEEGGVRISQTAAVKLAKITAQSANAYSNLLDHVIRHCARAGRLDDAQKGTIERNLRRAFLSLIRSYGPIEQIGKDFVRKEDQNGYLLNLFARDLPEDVGRSALYALAGYVEEVENRIELSTFVRAYSALAIRNLDPVGRRWQQATLSRSTLALDTDAVLHLLVKDVPEHESILQAVLALQKSGVSIVVPELVLEEVADNVKRASRTYRRFARGLTMMSPAMVDGDVWHVVVRGFYYAVKGGYTSSWSSYWRGYYDRESPLEYLAFVLRRRFEFSTLNLQEIPREWEADFEVIAGEVLKGKEEKRRKAQFRDDVQMADRIRKDVRMALHLSSYGGGANQAARGYLASMDLGFLDIEDHDAWGSRQRVLIMTRSLPGLVEFVCGEAVADEVLVRLLFDPIIGIAAHLADEEIRSLTRLGVDLRSISLERLEWDLSRKFKASLRELADQTVTESPGELLDMTVEVLEDLQDSGYGLHPRVAELAREYRGVVKTAKAERERRVATQDQLLMIAEAAAGHSKKGRRRVSAVLRSFGIELEGFGSEDDASPSE